jgi:hypothetical protein
MIGSMKKKWYSPQLERPLVGALYREAKARRIPMTTLANGLLWKALSQETRRVTPGKTRPAIGMNWDTIGHDR